MLKLIYCYAKSKYKREHLGEVMEILVDFCNFIQSREGDELVRKLEENDD